jgi:hypothetical protein
VLSTEDNIISEENTNEAGMDFELPSSKSKKSMNSDLILPDTEDEDEEPAVDSDQKKKSKKNAIKEYREALSSIGSKSTGVTSSGLCHGKKAIDKVIVTENEYDANQDWLINDVEVAERKISNKKFVGSGTRVLNPVSTSGRVSTKRKSRNDENDGGDCDMEQEESAQCRNVDMNEVDSNDANENDDEADFAFCRAGKSKAAKKRIIDSCPSEDDLMKNYDNHVFEDLHEEVNAKPVSSTKNFSFDKLKGTFQRKIREKN